jgi:hypothetical protein
MSHPNPASYDGLAKEAFDAVGCPRHAAGFSFVSFPNHFFASFLSLVRSR